MSSGARILETEAMAEARAALAEFAEVIDRALAGVDADILRMTQWLRQERPLHWKREVRVREEEVLKAKVALSRKELMSAPAPAKAVEERQAVDRATRRLDEARRRQEATRRWALAWDREAMAYKGGAQALRTMTSAGIPGALSRISRMMESVEAYLDAGPPKAGPQDPAPDEADPPARTPETDRPS